jgi:hypothetical protein
MAPDQLAISESGATWVAYKPSNGIYVSRDYGQTWTLERVIGYADLAIDISADGTKMVAAGREVYDPDTGAYSDGYMFISTDGGDNWVQKTAVGRKAWKRLAISDDGTKIFATTHYKGSFDSNNFYQITDIGSAFYSTNSGTTFTESNFNGYQASSNQWTDVAMTGDGGKIFLAGLYDGIMVSTNFGASWTNYLANEYIEQVEVSKDGAIVYVGGQYVAKNSNGNYADASSWTQLANSPWAAAGYYALAASIDGRILYAAVQNGTLHHSLDYGQNWTVDDITPDHATDPVLELTQPRNMTWGTYGLVASGNGQYVAVDISTGPLLVAKNVADTPANIVSTIGSRTVSLSWDLPASNGSVISDYLVQYSGNSGSSWTTLSRTASTSRSATVSGLNNGGTYQFRVAAVTNFGNSVYSSAISATPGTLPETATTLTGTPANQGVNLTWSAPSSDGGYAISDYLIEYRLGTGSWNTFSHTASSSTSISVTGLSNGSSYTFRVSAINQLGTGPLSLISSSITPRTTPSAPGSLSATGINSGVVLSWTTPSSDGGSALTDYVAEYSSDSGATWSTFSGAISLTRVETVTSLSNGTQYSFRVSAINAAGTGTASSSATATPSTTASAPTSLVVTAGNRQVSLAFTAGATGGSAISDYLVEYSSNSGSSWTTFIHTATSNSPIVVTGLTNYTAYIFRLTPINGNGIGATSSASASATPRGTLTSISLSRQSVGSASGSAFSTQPQITLVDQYSATLLTDSVTVVTATISAGGTLAGTTTSTAVAGIATFAGLGITGTSGTSYTISYSVDGMNVLTQSVTVTVGPATKLRISRNSSGTQTGATFTTQPIILIVDTGNNTVSTFQNTTITATVNNSTCFMGIRDTATATSGSATYSNLSLTGASGTQCLITYSAANLTSTSETVTLLAGAAASINRLTRPDFGYYGRPFGQQPVYTITDMGGNVVTTDNTTILTISTPNNVGSTILQESQTAVNGIVTFTGLGISGINAGTFTQIRVSSSSFNNPYSDSIFMEKGDPVLSWSNFTKLSGDAPFTVTAPTSNAAGTFTYSSSNTGVATVSGSTITVVGQGTTTLTATLTPTDTTNFNSSVSVTTTLSVSAGAATVTISLAGGVVTIAKGTPIAITASVNVTGRVSFYINGKPIGGCTSRHTTSSVSCTWKPAIQGQSVTLSALLRPSSGNYTNARSNLLQVGVGRRTGRR